MSLADIFVIILIAAALAFIVYRAVKKLSSAETCCGTKKEKRTWKRLENPIGSVTLHVSGMRCENCAARITNAINAMDGCSARVSLSTGEVKVYFDRETDKARLISAVESLGYLVTDTETP